MTTDHITDHIILSPAHIIYDPRMSLTEQLVIEGTNHFTIGDWWLKLVDSFHFFVKMLIGKTIYRFSLTFLRTSFINLEPRKKKGILTTLLIQDIGRFFLSTKSRTTKNRYAYFSSFQRDIFRLADQILTKIWGSLEQWGTSPHFPHKTQKRRKKWDIQKNPIAQLTTRGGTGWGHKKIRWFFVLIASLLFFWRVVLRVLS